MRRRARGGAARSPRCSPARPRACSAAIFIGRARRLPRPPHPRRRRDLHRRRAHRGPAAALHDRGPLRPLPGQDADGRHRDRRVRRRLDRLDRPAAARSRSGRSSAGADPGPICYRRGGTEPTVTDANLVLGRIPAARSLGARCRSTSTPARERRRAAWARELGLAARGGRARRSLEIAAWNQCIGIRQVSIERGREPSDYCLVAFGGVRRAARRPRSPSCSGSRPCSSARNPGNLSAFGLQVSDVKRDYVRTLVRERVAARRRRDRTGLDRARAARARRPAWARASRAEAIVAPAHRPTCATSARAHEVQVPATDGRSRRRAAAGAVRALPRGARAAPSATPTRASRTVELVNLRVQAVGDVSAGPRCRPTRRPRRRARPSPSSSRDVYFDGLGCGRVPDPPARRVSPPGARLDGPAIVEEFGLHRRGPRRLDRARRPLRAT